MNIISLKNQKEFDLVSKSGFKIKSYNFLLIISKDLSSFNPPQERQLLLGMKVGKRLSNKAVIRNKIKRRIRHIIRLIYSSNLNASSLALIVIPYKGFESTDFSLLLNEFKSRLKTRS